MSRKKLEIDPALFESGLPVRTIAKRLGVFPSTVYKYRREAQGFKLESPAERKKQDSCKSWSVCFPSHAGAKIEASALAEGVTPPVWLKRRIMEMLGYQPFPQERPDTPQWVREHGRRTATEYTLRYYIYRNAALDAIGYSLPKKTVQSWGAYYDAVEGKLCQGGTPQDLYDAFLAIWPHLQQNAK